MLEDHACNDFLKVARQFTGGSLGCNDAFGSAGLKYSKCP